MTLYLLRHAEAEDTRTTDFARALTPKGEQQAQRVGRFCAAQGIAPELILHSPLRRTEQTAAFFATAFAEAEAAAAPNPKSKIEIPKSPEPWLASGMEEATALLELRAYGRLERLLLIGHEPDLGLLAAALLGVEQGGGLHVRKASLIALTLSAFRPGAATLDFFLPVKFME